MSIDNLEKKYNFLMGVDHMNQVVSFDRIVYFGYIQDQEQKRQIEAERQAEKEARLRSYSNSPQKSSARKNNLYGK